MISRLALPSSAPPWIPDAFIINHHNHNYQQQQPLQRQLENYNNHTSPPRQGARARHRVGCVRFANNSDWLCYNLSVHNWDLSGYNVLTFSEMTCPSIGHGDLSLVGTGVQSHGSQDSAHACGDWTDSRTHSVLMLGQVTQECPVPGRRACVRLRNDNGLWGGPNGQRVDMEEERPTPTVWCTAHNTRLGVFREIFNYLVRGFAQC
ncbi:hypothetical protein EGW08_021687 [Elysia chlorotica]|uniref:Uncharacterized protein n=1 Tax=Elysia chlorotica TaxID=188477 RepID=A0A3S0Z4J2_ELYCH|nr:hypothetical protein EGW08_021687 [Elysia chlorotica]